MRERRTAQPCAYPLRSLLAGDPVPGPAELVAQLVRDHVVGPGAHRLRVGARLRQILGELRVDPQEHAPLVQLRDLPGIDESVVRRDSAARDDHAVENVHFGVCQHVGDLANLAAVARVNGNAFVQREVRDRAAEILHSRILWRTDKPPAWRWRWQWSAGTERSRCGSCGCSRNGVIVLAASSATRIMPPRSRQRAPRRWAPTSRTSTPTALP